MKIVKPTNDELKERIKFLENSNRLLKKQLGVLEERDSLFTGILDNIPYQVVQLDKNMNYKFVNRAYAEWRGRKIEDFAGKKVSEIVSKENYKEALPYFKKVLAGEATFFELPVTVNDNIFYAVASYIPRLNDKRKVDGIYVFFKDITEKKNIDIRLKQEEEHLRTLLDCLPDGFFELDKNWHFIYINRVAAQNENYEQQKLIGKSIWKKFPHMAGNRYESMFRQVMDSGEPLHFEIRDDENDRWYDYNVYPSVAGISVFWNDITIRKKNEARYAFQSHLMDKVSDAIIFVNGKGNITFWNEGAAKVYGWQEDEVMNKTFDQVVGQDFFRMIKNGSGKNRKEIIQSVEFFHPRRDGSKIWTENSVKVIRNSEGTINGYLLVSRDISERRKTEEAMVKQAELIDLSPDAIMVRTYDGVISFWSKGAEKLYGWTKDEVIGKVTHELFKTKFPLPLEEIESMLKLEGRWSGELVHNRKNGDIIIIQSFQLAKFDKEGKIVSILESNVDITKRKNAEKELQLGEERFRLISEKISIGLALARVRDSKIIYANPVYHEMAGIPQGELIGRNTPDFYSDPADRDKILLILKKQGFLKNYPVKLKKLDGSTFWISSNIQFIEYQNEPVIMASSIDITERMLMEEALQESEKRYRLIVEHAPAAIYEINFIQKRFKSVNEAMCKMVGYTEPELLVLNPLDILDKESGELFYDRKRKAEAGEPLVDSVEYKARKKDGSEIWCLLHVTFKYDGNKIIGASVVAHDITERKKFEMALRLSEERFSKAFNLSPYAVIITRLSDGTYVNVNDSFLKMFGYSRDEVIGRTANDINIYANPEGRAGYLAAFKKGRVTDFEIDLKTKTGIPLKALGYAEIININGQDLTIGTMIDITERKRNEMALLESEKRYRILFEGLPLSTVVFQKEGNDFIIKEYNEAAEKLTKGGMSKFVGRSAREIYKERPEILEQFELVQEKKPILNFQSTYKTLSTGEDIYLNMTLAFVAPDRIIALTEDISALKKAEVRLKFQANLLTNISDVVYSTDLNLCVTSWNRAAEKIYGLKEADTLGKSILDITGSKFDPESRHKLTTELLEKGMVSAQIEHMNRSGSVIIFDSVTMNLYDAEGKVVGFVAVNRDITERKRAEESVIRSQKTFYELVERAPFGIYIVDSAFCISHMNLGSQKGAFRNVHPVIGRPFNEAMHILWSDDVAEEIISYFRHTLETGEPYFSPYFMNPRNDVGIVEAYEWELHRIMLPDGQYSVICYFFDSTNLRTTEESLRQSEARFRSVLDNSRDFIYRTNLLTGHYEYVSSSVKEILGFTADEFASHTVETSLMTIHPDDLDAAIAMMKRIEDTGTGELEYRLKNKQGEYRWVSNLFVVIKDSSGQPLYRDGSVRDITERKKVEESLRENEERFLQMFRLHQAVKLVIEPGSGAIVDANEAAAKFYGYSVKELCALDIHDINLLPPNAVNAEMKKAAHEQKKIFTFPHRLANGVVRWVEVYSSPVKTHGKLLLYSIIHDITERKIAEEKLESTLQRFYLILSSMHNGILLVTNEGRVEFANQAFCDLFGMKESHADLSDLSANEMLEKIKLSYKNPDEAIARINEIVRLGQPVLGEDISMSGDRVFLRNFIPIYVGEKLYGRLWNHIDITERKRNEEELRLSRERLSAVFNGVSETLMLLDMEGNILASNNVADSRFSKNASSIVGKNMYDIIPVQFHEQRKKQVSELIQTKKPVRFLDNLKDIFLEIIFYPVFDVQGNIKQFISSALDITERKKAEEALAASEYEFRLLTESMPQIVWTTTADGQNTYFNHQWMEYTGLTLEESYGHGWNKPFHPDDQQRAWDAWQNAVQHNAPYLLQCRLQRFDGVYRWWLIHGVPVVDKNGTITKWYGTCTDIDEMKNAEDTLQDSEEKFRAIFDNNSSAIAIIEPDTTISMVNDVFCQISGFKKEEVIGTSWTQKIAPEDLDRLKEYNRKRFLNPNDAPDQYEFKFYRKDGEVRNALMSVCMIQSIQKIVISLVDITERKKSEEALKESEERFVKAFQSNPAALSISRLADGLFVDVNESFIRLFGYDRDELIGVKSTNIKMYSGSGDRDKLVRLLQEDGKISNYEIIAQTKNGETLNVLISAEKISFKGQEHILFSSINMTERKQAEDKLSESEARYRLLVEQAVDGIFLADAQGRYIEVNAAGASMLGYTPEEVMQLTVIDILTPEELERLPSQLTTLSSGGVITNEWQFRRKDGSTFPGELVGRQLPDGSLLGMLRDITERKLAEEALRKGEQRVRDIVESLHDGFFSLDRSFRLTYVNQQAATNLGMTKEQMIGGIIWDVFPNIVGTIQETEYRSAMTGHQPHIFELKGVLTPYEYEIRCYPTADGIAVFIINITERKKVEEKLQESEQRLKYHFENSPLAVVEWDADYFVTQWSKEAENIFGWKKEETLGKRIDTLNMIYTDDIPIVNRTMERLSGGKETMVVSSNRNYTKSGAVIVCVWYNSILLDEKGEMKSVMSLVQDITERKVAEEQLEKNAFELTELNATKDKFFSIIAHDLRNPFTSLLGVSDLMMENAEKFDEERVRKSATLINSSARKAYTLLENLLEWSRSQSGNIKIKPEPFKLCEHVEGIISALSVNADNKEINLNSEIEKEFQVVTDKNITHTIIRNLVSNAIKFTHKGGSVTVNAIKNERHVTVSIKDTGIGMSKDDIEKLFRIDVKYTKAGTNKETGTGLGLILCKEFVEKLGGRIWVESEPGKGSEFKFTIPTVNS